MSQEIVLTGAQVAEGCILFVASKVGVNIRLSYTDVRRLPDGNYLVTMPELPEYDSDRITTVDARSGGLLR